MATLAVQAQKTEADALGLYYTHSDKSAQFSPDASLGGWRSQTELERLSWYVQTPMPSLTIRQVSGTCGVGTGYISLGLRTIVFVESPVAQWKAPGSSFGTVYF